MPGMLHGRVIRPPVVNSAPADIDESSIRNISGGVKIVQEGNFVGVVAKTEWAAIQAAEKLQVTWSEPKFKLPATSDALYAYLRNTKSFTTLKGAEKGNPAEALGKAKKQYEASYRWPFQMHGMIGPSCNACCGDDGPSSIGAEASALPLPLGIRGGTDRPSSGGAASAPGPRRCRIPTPAGFHAGRHRRRSPRG